MPLTQTGPNVVKGTPQAVLMLDALIGMMHKRGEWTNRFNLKLGKGGLCWLICNDRGNSFSPSSVG